MCAHARVCARACACACLPASPHARAHVSLCLCPTLLCCNSCLRRREINVRPFQDNVCYSYNPGVRGVHKVCMFWPDSPIKGQCHQMWGKWGMGVGVKRMTCLFTGKPWGQQRRHVRFGEGYQGSHASSLLGRQDGVGCGLRIGVWASGRGFNRFLHMSHKANGSENGWGLNSVVQITFAGKIGHGQNRIGTQNTTDQDAHPQASRTRQRNAYNPTPLQTGTLGL